MCGRNGLWPKMYVDDMAVAEMVCGRYGSDPCGGRGIYRYVHNAVI